MVFLAFASAVALGELLKRVRVLGDVATRLSVVPVACLIFSCLSLAFAYSNVERALDEQERQIALAVAAAMNQHRVADGMPLVIEGVEPYPLRVRKTVEVFPILAMLSPRHFNFGWYWGVAFLEVHGLDLTHAAPDVRDRALAETQKPGMVPLYSDRMLSLYQAPSALVLKFASVSP